MTTETTTQNYTPLPSVVAAKVLTEELGEKYDVSTMALQKLLYLSHGYHLAWYGTPLLDEIFTVWPSGPVATGLQKVHQKCYTVGQCETIMGMDTSAATRSQRATIKAVLDSMGGLSGLELSEITSLHEPVRNNTMDNDSLRVFFMAETARTVAANR